MNVTFYSFTKRSRSTKLPDGIASSYDGTLKNNSNIVTPTILFNFKAEEGVGKTALFNPRLYNYAYISDWNRYYRVTDWRWNKGLWEADLTEDVLATYRDTIASTQFVFERSYSDNNVTALHDKNMVPLMSYTETSTSYPYLYFTPFYVNGEINDNSTVIMTCQGSKGYKWFAFRLDELSKVMNAFFPTIVSEGFLGWLETQLETGVTVGGVTNLPNFYQFIWLPLTYSTLVSNGAINTAYTQVNLGGYDTNISVTTLAKTEVVYGPYSISFDRHPNSDVMLELNTEPYTTLSLYLPPFGDIQLNSADFIHISVDDENNYTMDKFDITYTITINLISGKALLKIWSSEDSNYMVKVVEANVAQPLKWVGTGLSPLILAEGAAAAAGLLAKILMTAAV